MISERDPGTSLAKTGSPAKMEMSSVKFLTANNTGSTDKVKFLTAKTYWQPSENFLTTKTYWHQSGQNEDVSSEIFNSKKYQPYKNKVLHYFQRFLSRDIL